MIEMYINGTEALSKGIHMGEGFLSAIDGIAPMKETLVDDSRLEDGKRYIFDTRYHNSRDVTLPFVILGDDETDFRTKRKWFMEQLENGAKDDDGNYTNVVNIKVPVLENQVFHLVYEGNGVQYSINRKRCCAKFSAKFVEYNPTVRS